LLILVTSNVSQTAVAKAAEEEVDSFIIKPYTIKSIQESLLVTFSSKLSPSDYNKKIEQGKVLIQAGNLDEAEKIFNEATKLHPKPSLALFYIGQVELLKSHVQQAEGSYNKGLSYNNIHYKCLIGLYEIFIREGRLYDAYEVVKKIANYFPANPDRLTEVVRLTIQTANYEDMQNYYDIFTQIEERTPKLINYIGAGLFIAAKHCLQNNKEEVAFKLFENIAVSCSEQTKFIRAIIALLVENNKPEEAMKFLSRFPPNSDNEEDFLVSDFLVNSKMFSDSGFLIKAGLEIYNRNIRDYQCMVALVAAMEKSGNKPEKVLEFKEEMAKLWPDKVAP
jgi:tetratricopeptide (TPR) repeat protein